MDRLERHRRISGVYRPIWRRFYLKRVFTWHIYAEMWLFVQYVCIAFLWQSHYNSLHCWVHFSKTFCTRTSSAPCMQLNDCFAQWPHRTKTNDHWDACDTEMQRNALWLFVWLFIIVRRDCRSVTLLIYWHWLIASWSCRSILTLKSLSLSWSLNYTISCSSPGLCDLKM